MVSEDLPLKWCIGGKRFQTGDAECTAKNMGWGKQMACSRIWLKAREIESSKRGGSRVRWGPRGREAGKWEVDSIELFRRYQRSLESWGIIKGEQYLHLFTFFQEDLHTRTHMRTRTHTHTVRKGICKVLAHLRSYWTLLTVNHTAILRYPPLGHRLKSIKKLHRFLHSHGNA